MLCVWRCNDAGPAVRVRCWLVHTVQCREHTTGQQKVQFYYEDDTRCPFKYEYIIYLYGHQTAKKASSWILSLLEWEYVPQYLTPLGVL